MAASKKRTVRLKVTGYVTVEVVGEDVDYDEVLECLDLNDLEEMDIEEAE